MIRVESIQTITVEDHDPDVSWLDQTDAEMGIGWEEHARGRKDSYNRGDWHMVGVYVVAIITYGTENDEFLHTIKSPGIWGIESDSGVEYLQEIAQDELVTLCDMLREMNVDSDSLNVAVKSFSERERNTL